MSLIPSSFGGGDLRDVPILSVGDAARYLRLPTSTLSAWVDGHHVGPIIKTTKRRMLSFWNLEEAFVIAAIRRRSLSVQRIRKALRFLQERMGVARPLIEESFSTDGAGLFVERLGQLVDVTSHGQLAMREVLESHLHRVSWSGGKAAQFSPFIFRPAADTEPQAVVFDPTRGFGRPVITGTSLRTDIIAERHAAGESVDLLADDYGLTVEQIRSAVFCEARIAA